MTKYRFTSAALTELTQATHYYEQRENGLGTAFLDEVDATVNRILQHPHRLAPTVPTDKTLSNASLSVRSDLPDPH
jgi:hypothetical protein